MMLAAGLSYDKVQLVARLSCWFANGGQGKRGLSLTSILADKERRY